jgi:hypothetical protein
MWRDCCINVLTDRMSIVKIIYPLIERARPFKSILKTILLSPIDKQ